MVQRVVLHLGSHKTGSTSIQNALKRYDDGDTLYADLGNANHSAPLFTAFSERKYGYHIWVKQGLTRQQIDQRGATALVQLNQHLARTDRHTLILSAEDLSLLYPAEVEALLSMLRGAGRSLLVICYVRHPLDYAVSVCQQLIKGGSNQLPELFSPAYRRRLEPYLERLHPEELVVRQFDRIHLQDGCVVADFCSIIGIKSSALTIRNRNESLPAAAVHALYQLNCSGLLLFGDRQLVQARHHLIMVLRQLFVGEPHLSRDLLHPHADYEDCGFLADHFGIVFILQPPTDPPAVLSLHQWLEQPEPADERRIQLWLQHNAGLIGPYQQLGGSLQRLFFLCIHSAMLAEHRELLRRVASKAIGGEALSAEEGLTLRQLARQARPGSIAAPSAKAVRAAQ